MRPSREDLPACTCGKTDWKRHGSYHTAQGIRRRWKCSGCGKAIGLSKLIRLAAEKKELREKKLRKRPQAYDREEFWTRVLRNFPGLILSAALERIRDRMGMSKGLVTRLVQEELDGHSVLRARRDDKADFLRHCLEVRASGVPAPKRKTELAVDRISGQAAEACWKAIWRARATAALLRDARAGATKRLRGDPRATAFRVDDLRTGLPGAMPGFLEWFAPDTDPWRPLYPGSPTGVSTADVERFPDLLKEAFPELPPDLAGFRWLQEWRSKKSKQSIYTWLCEPKPYDGTYQTWLKDRLPPGVEPDVALARMEAVFKQILPPHIEDPRIDREIDAGLSYSLLFWGGAVRCYVATRRRIIGSWREPGAFGRLKGSVVFRPVLEEAGSYSYDEWFQPPPGNLSLQRLPPPYPPPKQL